MRINEEAFMALLEPGKEEGLARRIIATPGEAATFIAMLSMAVEREDSRGAAGDRRLR
jgi:hypothetical protein